MADGTGVGGLVAETAVGAHCSAGIGRSGGSWIVADFPFGYARVARCPLAHAMGSYDAGIPRYVGKFGAKTIEPLATSINACVRGTFPGV